MDKTVKADKPKPYLNLNEDDLPEIKNWKIKGKYKITATIQLKSLNDSLDNGMSASFDILDINDKAFKDKSYKDIMEEDSESQDNQEEENDE